MAYNFKFYNEACDHYWNEMKKTYVHSCLTDEEFKARHETIKREAINKVWIKFKENKIISCFTIYKSIF